MRIAVLNDSSTPVGGTGSYLRAVIPALTHRGHPVCFWSAHGGRPNGDPIHLPADSPSWSVEEAGLEGALASLQNWSPDVILSQGFQNPEVEARSLRVARAVFVAQSYYGTCISGAKTFRLPTTTPCARTFGWPCLVHYFPRRCGGRSPVTMAREFRRQSARFTLLSQYQAIVTMSAHMQQEYARHGLKATCVMGALEPGQDSAPVNNRDRNISQVCHLLFVGRMDELKGGRYLLDALPRVLKTLGRTLVVTFVGDACVATKASVRVRVLQTCRDGVSEPVCCRSTNQALRRWQHGKTPPVHRSSS